MKPNSFDLEHELLASAKEAIEIYDSLAVDYDERPGFQILSTPAWDAAYLRLKAAVAQYDQRA